MKKIQEGSGGPVVALLERQTTLVILAIGAVAALVLTLVERLAVHVSVVDQWGVPLMALILSLLFLRLRQRPGSLLKVQRTAVFCLQGYFITAGLYLAFFDQAHISLYWLATTFMWTFLATVLVHITWPQRQAAAWALLLQITVSLPPFIVRNDMPAAQWQGEFQPLLISAWLVQVALMLSLMSVSHLRHGVMQLLSTGGPVGPSDARHALDTWLQEKTETLARALDSAESASRAKSQFLAVMSHELRTPLHAMMVSADLLEERHDGPLSEREARLVHTIQSSGKHLLALIDQVLDLSRIESGKVVPQHEPLDLWVVCQRATEAVSPMVQRKQLNLDFDADPQLAAGRWGDPLRLTQVLINLLANAAKFTDRGGIGLSVQGGDAGWVRFVVSDTGPGMSLRAQQHVFEAFYQVDDHSTRQHGGVGLGLTITRELVELMGGTLDLDSEEGHGTRVTIVVPLPENALGPASVESNMSLGERLGGVRVLVVEDDPVNAMLALEVLQGVGAEVHSADSGQAALDFLRQQDVDVVLMDFRMPGMDGLEATRRLRAGEVGEIGRQVPVLGLTANAFEEDRAQCLQAGMSDVLTKPIDRRTLIRAVHEWHRLVA